MKSWSNGKVVNGKVSIDSFNYSLHYSGPCVWEGIRSYVQDDGTCKVFRLKEHVNRLKDSARIIGYDIPYSSYEIEKACETLVSLNGNKDFYLRPVAYVDAQAEGIHSLQSKELKLDIYCVTVPSLHLNPEEGIRMVISNVVRSYPQFNMQAKTPANYSVLTSLRSLLDQTGAQDAFVLDNNGYVVESTVANFFVVKGDVLMTPPNNGSILCGVTRQTLAEILTNSSAMFVRYKKVPKVVEKSITKADIYTADCVFLCGTYAEVVKVKEVDGRNVDVDDFYFRMLKREYSDKVRGRS